MKSIVVYALLDSQSTAGAFRFTIRPGAETVFDVQSTLFPRVDIDEAGIAPLTSMFSSDFNNRIGVDDYRPAVHDSDSLLMRTGRGEQLLRRAEQPDRPAVQRLRRRQSARLRPDAAASARSTTTRIWKRITRSGRAAGWSRSATGARARSIWWKSRASARSTTISSLSGGRRIRCTRRVEYDITYRLHWCEHVPWTSPLAQVAATRSGLAWDRKGRLFVIDFTTGAAIKALAKGVDPTAQVHADHGTIKNVVAQPNPESGGWRISFELLPAAKLVELRAQLMDGKKPLSETWLYRWTP